MNNKDLLIDEFSDALLNLTKLRIEDYHRTQQGVIDFINDLIFCPIQSHWDKDDLTAASQAIDKFINYLHINLIDVEHVEFRLTPSSAVNYTVWFDVTSFGEEFFGEQIFVNYCEGKCEITDEDEYFEIMSQLSEESLRNYIMKIQSEEV